MSDASRLIGDTSYATKVLGSMRDRVPTWVRDNHPEIAALAVVPDSYRAIEHEGEGNEPQPLIEHLATRVLGRKLRGLERRELGVFQHDDALSEGAFAQECELVELLSEADLLTDVRAALIHSDFAKGGAPEQRAAWGHDLTVHNLAAARVLGQVLPRRFERYQDPARSHLVVALVQSHGLCGQSVRGETPLALLAPFIAYLRSEWLDELATEMALPRAHAVDLAVDCLHVINICDTAGVREGLLTDALRAELIAVENQLRGAGRAEVPDGLAEIEIELAAKETSSWGSARARLTDRVMRLRQGRIRDGEPVTDCMEAIDALGDETIHRLSALLANCQLWYCEAATGGLAVASQLSLLALAVRAAELAPQVDVTRSYHVSLQPLVARLAGGDAKAHYRRRLIETLLAPLTISDILGGSEQSDALMGTNDRAHALGTFTTQIGDTTAVAVDFKESEEAAALLTLLALYERKSSAKFHNTLKLLCDMYGLRKDEFDRVANEAAYLGNMNAARSDKSRMLDYAKPGRLVEVGPGGGVVLDLLEDRFEDSEVIGIDVSAMAVKALEARRARDGRQWRIIEADAFELAEHVGPSSVDTIVFCSVLHEIYSYVERDGERYQLEPVADILRAAYQALRPGGRILIRDGIAPPPGRRRIRFLASGARELFDLFVEQFEGLTMEPLELAPDRVELPSHQAMEFLYTYNWGPQSFPYEVREQYGVLGYAAYRDSILTWLADAEHPPRWIELPAEIASYLQDGYRTNLADRIELTDEHDQRVPLPDSNCLMVIEKS